MNSRKTFKGKCEQRNKQMQKEIRKEIRIAKKNFYQRKYDEMKSYRQNTSSIFIKK